MWIQHPRDRFHSYHTLAYSNGCKPHLLFLATSITATKSVHFVLSHCCWTIVAATPMNAEAHGYCVFTNYIMCLMRYVLRIKTIVYEMSAARAFPCIAAKHY